MDLEFNHIKNHFLDETGEGPAGGSGDANAYLGGQDGKTSSDRGTGGTEAKTPTVESLTAELTELRESHKKLSGDHKQLTEKWHGKLKSERSEAFRKGGKADDAAAGEGNGAGDDGKTKGKGADGKTAGGESDGAKPDPDDDFELRFQEKETQKAFYDHAEKTGASAEESAKILSDIAELRFGDMPHARMLDLAQQLTTGRFHEAILENALKEHGEKVRLDTIKQVREDIRVGRMPLQSSSEKAASAAPDQNMERANKALRELS
jgi:hypothetical protein